MPKEIILDLGGSENKFKTYFPWIAALLALTIIVFGIGFGIAILGKDSGLFSSEEQIPKSETRENWYVLESDNFSIEYSNSWKVEAADGADNAKIANENGQVELWIDKKGDIRFTKKQLSKQKGKKDSEIKIDGRSGQMTEHLYKNGEFFITINIPSDKTKDKITFWIAAINEETKNTTLEIVKTFKTKTK